MASWIARLGVAAMLTTAFVLIPVSPTEAVPGSGVASDLAGRGMSAIFESTAQGMVVWVLEAVGYFTNGIVNFLKTAARPEIDAVWFSGPTSPYSSVRNVALMLLLAFAFLGLISGLLRGDVEGMLRRIGGNLPIALFGMVATTVITAKLLDVTDALSTAVLEHSGSNALDFLAGFSAAATAATGGFATLTIGVVAIFTAFLLWVELLIRSALVYFLVALSPLAFAATLWPATRPILRRLAELLIAVIFSKFAICVALAIGAAALGGTGHVAQPDTGIGDAAATRMGSLLSGTVLLGLACWSPFLLVRMLPVVESAVIAQGISRGPMRGAQTAISTVSSVNSVSRLAGGATAVTQQAGNAAPSRLAGNQSPAYVRKPQEHTR